MNILLVDDNQKSREAIGQVLGYLGHRITQCSDGWEAFSMLEQVNYDLVITDHEMPRMTGLELLQQMHSLNNNQNTEVVVLTGNSQATLRNQALVDGAYAYLLKPISLDQLLQVLKNLNNPEPAK